MTVLFFVLSQILSKSLLKSLHVLWREDESTDKDLSIGGTIKAVDQEVVEFVPKYS